MAFNAVTYALSKKYTDTEVAGGGAIQGKNCVISSIADIPATESKPAGQRVTFQWTLDNGTVETGTMDVYNGKDGESIDRMYVNEEGHLIVVYDNGESEDCGEITIPSSQSDWAEDDPEENSYIQHKELVYSAINDAVSAERSARQIVEAQLSAAISAISDDVSSQGTAIGTINRQLSSLIDDVGTNTSAISSINTQLSAIIDDVGTNTSAISTINRQLSAVIDDVGTNTSAISAINQDLASRADIKSIGTGLNLDSTTGELTATGGGGGTTDYADLTNKPSINNVTLSGNKTSADLGFGTASALNVASSGDASSTEVVKGNDTRLTDSRNAADVYSWAKEATKPSYTASEVGAIASTEKGANSGVAELDTNGKVPSAQLPSYVDDVVEYASTSAFPATGESGKIYIALDTNKTYRWGGSEYVEISESLALGETASTAYAGNKGKANADAISAIKDGQTIDSFGDVETALSGKADKVTSATNGNFAGLDANGNLTDSGKRPSDYTPTFTGTQAEWTAEQNKERYTIVNIIDDVQGSGGGGGSQWKLEDDYPISTGDEDFDIWLRKADIFDGDLRIDIIGFDQYGSAPQGCCSWFIPNWVLVELWDGDYPMRLEEKPLYFYDFESDTVIKTTCAFTLEGNMRTTNPPSERIYYKLVINALCTDSQHGTFQVNVYTNSPTFQPSN